MWPLNCCYWKSLIDSVWSPRCTCTSATVNIYERPKLDSASNQLLFLSLSLTSGNDPQGFVQLRKLCGEYLLVDMYYWYCLWLLKRCAASLITAMWENHNMSQTWKGVLTNCWCYISTYTTYAVYACCFGFNGLHSLAVICVLYQCADHVMYI